MVNMCVPSQWRVDAAAWHLIYGCMQGEGWSRPPLSLNQIISAPRRNKWWLLASLNSLSHIFILFIYCGAIPRSPLLVILRVLPCPALLHYFSMMKYSLILLINVIPQLMFNLPSSAGLLKYNRCVCYASMVIRAVLCLPFEGFLNCATKTQVSKRVRQWFKSRKSRKHKGVKKSSLGQFIGLCYGLEMRIEE